MHSWSAVQSELLVHASTSSQHFDFAQSSQAFGSPTTSVRSLHDAAGTAESPAVVDVSAPASVRAGRLLSPSLPVLLLQAPPAAATIVSPVNPTRRTNLDKATASEFKRTASWPDRQTVERQGLFLRLYPFANSEIHCQLNLNCRIGLSHEQP